ncbi:MAG: low affinity iron permease family protein [Saprospiraceae bacterium]|nr:low affinity iron permease family protein [Saprospiraceae bacterium]MDZ4703463.1 low affinity iron permease family protein [Saprospiraceae bacterium]
MKINDKTSKGLSRLEKTSTAVTKASGSSIAFIVAFSIILVWLATGPLFNYSDTWQLVINTGTTIITFLMVFLIQRSQNKDSIAIHIKLNELVVAHKYASNRLVSIEDISEHELKILQKYYKHLAEIIMQELSIEESHSILEANRLHERKKAERSKKAKANADARSSNSFDSIHPRERL